jgi:hypothetical protein
MIIGLIGDFVLGDVPNPTLSAILLHPLGSCAGFGGMASPTR